LKCSIDIAAAIESAMGAINVIMKATNKCGALDTVNHGCGMATAKLVQHMSGVAASSGEIAQKCREAGAFNLTGGQFIGKTVTVANWGHANAAMCVVDMKDSLKSLMHSAVDMAKMKDKCGSEGDDCTDNVLSLVGSLSELGGHMAGAFGHCHHKAVAAECGEAISELIGDLVDVAETGNEMKVQCSVPVKEVTKTVVLPNNAPKKVVKVMVEEPRLFEQGNPIGSSNTNFVLVALLPVTAMLSFVGGRIYARRSAQARALENEELE